MSNKDYSKLQQKVYRYRMDDLINAIHVNQGLIGINSMKAYIHLSNLKMPSMNYASYFRFTQRPDMVIRWLTRCDFLPLFFTGGVLTKQEEFDQSFFMDHLDECIENETGRYSIDYSPLKYATRLLDKHSDSRITPHVVLDMRGMGPYGVCKNPSTYSLWCQQIFQLACDLQRDMTEYGHDDLPGDWNIEHNHNPMITALFDTNWNAEGPSLKDEQGDYKPLYNTVINDDISDRRPLVGTGVITCVRHYTK